jgi:transposase
LKQKQYTEEFKREAVRILLASGIGTEAVAKDLGIGKSTLGKWRQVFQSEEMPGGSPTNLPQEIARLRRENELLRQERDLLKKATAFFARETNR